MATSTDYATRRELHGASLGEARLAHLFGAPFLSHVWPDSEELNQDLRRRILVRERDATARSVTRSNVGGWQSDSGSLEWCGEAGKVLGARMLAMANEATRQLLVFHGKQLPGFRWILEAWANVNRTGDFNQPHVHGGSTWSGTYYVDPGEPAPDAEHGTALYLIDAGQAGAGNFFPDLVPPSIFIRPEAGKMVLFPSYLLHMVFAHRGKRPRISIAFNLRKEPFP